ncbi:Suf-domain-containing protein [Atractiella rhizophila]|nr:Suf-domain-containing protein [Atractiella rhizophila]
MAAMYFSQGMKKEKLDEASQYLKWGIEANPQSLLLHYTYISILESRKQHTEAYALFDSLISFHISQLDDMQSSMQAEVTEQMSNEDIPPADREDRRLEIEAAWKKRTDKVKERLGNVWIMEMRFAIRAEGMKQARQVFAKARKKQAYVSWQVFEAAALIEYHWNKDSKVSTNIFELGMKSYGEDVGFAVRYLDFLISVNDTSNARAHFEKTVAKITDPEKSKPIWERWAEYEYQFGDLNAIQKLDERWSEMFPTDPSITHFARRYTYRGLEGFLCNLNVNLAPLRLRT